MSTKRFTEAMGYIDDDLISDAVTYMPKKKSPVRWMKWGAVAACFCLIFTGISIFNNGTKSSDSAPGAMGFVLTAYALENDNSVTATEMHEGDSIPVTMFEADNGLWGFIFSHEAKKPTDYISFSIMTAGEQGTIDQQIEAINGLDLKKTENYIFFIPPQGETGPFNVPLTTHNEIDNTVTMLNVVIEQIETGYIARIDSMSVHEMRLEPPK